MRDVHRPACMASGNSAPPAARSSAKLTLAAWSWNGPASPAVRAAAWIRRWVCDTLKPRRPRPDRPPKAGWRPGPHGLFFQIQPGPCRFLVVLGTPHGQAAPTVDFRSEIVPGQGGLLATASPDIAFEPAAPPLSQGAGGGPDGGQGGFGQGHGLLGRSPPRPGPRQPAFASRVRPHFEVA